jgi:putative molybdopterin biosynthesis protein
MTNHVERYRSLAHLSAAELAARIGVTRQTVYAIEAGTYVPNTAVALKLARVLNTTVESLFSEDDAVVPESIEPLRANQAVRLAQVNGRLIAVPSAALQLPVSTPAADNAILVAGCDPAIFLLGPNVIPYNCGSTRALELLAAGKVHIAGTHIGNSPKKGHRVVTLAHWQEGIVTAPGNPRRIRSIADLAGRRIVNREAGSGSRLLLDRELRKAGIEAGKLKGHGRIAAGHLEAAWYVHAGIADACIAPTSAARAYGLDFVPIATERYDLVIPDAFDAAALLNALVSAPVRRLLETQAGYDASRTGQLS